MDHCTDTRTRLLDAAEKVICEARGSLDISVRRIVAEAGSNVSSVSYHFESLEKLGVATADRVYRRLNAERLAELQDAIARAAPRTPPLPEIIRALIGTSVRWRLDPDSAYPVFVYLSRLSSLSDHPQNFAPLIRNVEHHRIFADYLGRAAPWFARTEIAWRLNAALGVRSQFTRQAERWEVLAGAPMGGDAEQVISDLCDIIVPMFARPERFRGAGTTPGRSERPRSNTV